VCHATQQSPSGRQQHEQRSANGAASTHTTSGRSLGLVAAVVLLLLLLTGLV
jgi:hypothetical protein